MKTCHACLLLVLFASFAAAADPLTISTVAGNGSPVNNGDHGPAEEMALGDPFGVEIGPDGGLYITEVRNHRVWRLDRQAHTLSVVAGCGRKGYSGDGGLATAAELNEPYEVRFDSDGNLFFVEMQNHIVRRVDADSGIITTVAGTGEQGYSGDGGPARQAKFSRPHSIALDGQGGLYIADIGNHRIRRVDLRSGRVDSIAGAEQRRLPQDGQIALDTPVLGPRALTIDGRTLWVALREGHSVWKLNLDKPVWRAVAGTGDKGYSGDGGPPVEATFNGPKGIAVGPNGNVYVVDTENHAIREIDLQAQRLRTVAGGRKGAAGDGGRADRAGLNRPHGICIAPNGTLYIGDTLNHRVRAVR